jgi:acetyl esterase/lipase
LALNHLPEIAAAGGDPRLVYVWGQSAGAHLAACAVVERAVESKPAAREHGLTYPVRPGEQSAVPPAASGVTVPRLASVTLFDPYYG